MDIQSQVLPRAIHQLFQNQRSKISLMSSPTWLSKFTSMFQLIVFLFMPGDSSFEVRNNQSVTHLDATDA